MSSSGRHIMAFFRACVSRPFPSTHRPLPRLLRHHNNTFSPPPHPHLEKESEPFSFVYVCLCVWIMSVAVASFAIRCDTPQSRPQRKCYLHYTETTQQRLLFPLFQCLLFCLVGSLPPPSNTILSVSCCPSCNLGLLREKLAQSIRREERAAAERRRGVSDRPGNSNHWNYV